MPQIPETPSKEPLPEWHPQIHGWDEDIVSNNLDPSQRALWQDVTPPKLFVYPWEAGYRPNAANTVALIKSVIANLLSIPKPAVGAPLAAITQNQRYAPPWLFLVTGITEKVAIELVTKQCWSTPAITFFAIPYAPLTSTFLCTIENLTFLDTEQDQVTKLVRATIQQNSRARDHIAFSSSPDALSAVLDSIDVQPLKMAIAGGGTKLVWNVYGQPPSPIPSRNREWKRIIGTLTFITALNGAGAPRQIGFACSGCKSTDHPSGLCLFPKTKGWHAPPNPK